VTQLPERGLLFPHLEQDALPAFDLPGLGEDDEIPLPEQPGGIALLPVGPVPAAPAVPDGSDTVQVQVLAAVIRHSGNHGYEADRTSLARHLPHYGLSGAAGVLDALGVRRQKMGDGIDSRMTALGSVVVLQSTSR